MQQTWISVVELFEDVHVGLVSQHSVGNDHKTGTASFQTLSCYPVYECSSCLSKSFMIERMKRKRRRGRGAERRMEE